MWDEISLKDLILISGGLTESAFLKRGYIFRRYKNSKEEIIPVYIDTTDNLAALDSIILRRNDRVEIFSKGNYKKLKSGDNTFCYCF